MDKYPKCPHCETIHNDYPDDMPLKWIFNERDLYHDIKCERCFVYFEVKATLQIIFESRRTSEE